MFPRESFVRGVLRPAFPSSLALQDRMVLSLNTLTGYFDESGTHTGSRAVAVAGYVSTVEQWERFEVEWQAALAEFGVPYFHMADFVDHKKQFKGGDRGGAAGAPDEARRNHQPARPCQRRVRDPCCGVRDPIFSSRAQRASGGAYGLAATICFMDAAMLLHRDYPTARIAYTFESGARGRGQS